MCMDSWLDQIRQMRNERAAAQASSKAEDASRAEEARRFNRAVVFPAAEAFGEGMGSIKGLSVRITEGVNEIRITVLDPSVPPITLGVSAWGSQESFAINITETCGTSYSSRSSAAERAGADAKKEHTIQDIVSYIAAAYRSVWESAVRR